ncbi:MAG: hypothetical protein IT438_12455 [Phycisphaerales bacterium]|nr:hypothetical protein [Phycisphaerales bacterium]
MRVYFDLDEVVTLGVEFEVSQLARPKARWPVRTACLNPCATEIALEFMNGLPSIGCKDADGDCDSFWTDAISCVGTSVVNEQEHEWMRGNTGDSKRVSTALAEVDVPKVDPVHPPRPFDDCPVTAVLTGAVTPYESK